MLKQKTRIILTGNTAPALNDVTYGELKLYCDKASADCLIIDKSLQNGDLQIIENGQKGPCLDLTNLSDGNIYTGGSKGDFGVQNRRRLYVRSIILIIIKKKCVITNF